MEGKCGCGCGGETLIFTCAGAAYSGQVSNRAGVQLMADGVGNLFCTAAIGAGASGKIKRAQAAGRRIAIDGCGDHCARKILERADLQVDAHIDVTTIGVEKSPATPHMIDDAKKIAVHVVKTIGAA